MPDLPTSASGKPAAAVARLCAQEASRIAMEAFGRTQDVLVKGRGNFLTETDMAAERATLTILREEYPEHEVMAEESAGEMKGPGEGWMWVVDPLDGTHNFSLGIPHFAFSIALCYERVPVLGLTYAPATGEEFFAEVGKGLIVNGEPARASTIERLSDCMLGIGLGYDDERAGRMLGLAAELWPLQAIRDMGSAALGMAYAACGRFDVFAHNSLFPWDIAAGLVLVSEGGGVAVEWDGEAASIDSAGAAAGAPEAVKELLTRAQGRLL